MQCMLEKICQDKKTSRFEFQVDKCVFPILPSLVLSLTLNFLTDELEFDLQKVVASSLVKI